MSRSPSRSLLLACIALVWIFAPGPSTRATADGDPLEEYNFSGKVPPDQFMQQCRTHAYQRGLWTIQHHAVLDPFKGDDWALESNRFERINVYYGTRPMWCSHVSYTAKFGAEIFGDKAPAGRFRKIVDTRKPDSARSSEAEVPAVDYTGGDGITLRLYFWNGAASGGSSAQLIRLSGGTPAEAKVEVLWSGAYEDFVDFDDDGLPEIVDTDFAHDYASYLPHKGLWGKVVLAWDAKAGRYVVANERLYLAAAQRHHEDKTKRLEASAWVAQRVQAVRDAVQSFRTSEADAVTKQGGMMLTLSGALFQLLWSGHVREARALFDEVDLPDYGPGYGDDSLTKRAWWAQFLAGCRGSKYWADLCGLFPELSTLK